MGPVRVFVAVEQAFVPMQGDFEQVFRHAPEILKQQGICSPSVDVSVRVERSVNPGLIETPLLGNSGGGAMALGLWSVWTDRVLEDHAIASFALTSSSASGFDGRCHSICFETEKLRAVANAAWSSGRQLTFLVADDQQFEFWNVNRVDIKKCTDVRAAVEYAAARATSEPIQSRGKALVTGPLDETEPPHKIKVCIARADEDCNFASQLAVLLRPYNIEVWDRRTIDRGTDENQAIEREIRECDHLLLVLSKATARSRQVAREIGLVLRLHSKRKRQRPFIVPVIVDDSGACATLQPLDFTTLEPIGKALSFAGLCPLDLRSRNLSEEVGKLARQLKPEITFVKEVDGDEGRLFWESVKVYEQLFPKEERDPPENIVQWLREGRLAEVNGLPFREVYGVLHKGETAMGMAYLTSYLDHHWTFGNYLGVLPCYRHDRMTERFLGEIARHLKELDHEMKGIVFEVEPVDWGCLVRAAKRGEIQGHDDEQEIKDSLRRLRRLNLYQASGCVALLGPKGRSLLVRTPALDGSKSREEEGEYVLMLRLFGTPEVELSKLLDFYYDALYKDAFCKGGVKYAGYERYIQGFRKKVERSAKSGWQLGEVALPSGPIGALVNELKRLAQKEGISVEISL